MSDSAIRHDVVAEGGELVCRSCGRSVGHRPGTRYDRTRDQLAYFLAAHPDPTRESHESVSMLVQELLGEIRASWYQGDRS